MSRLERARSWVERYDRYVNKAMACLAVLAAALHLLLGDIQGGCMILACLLVGYWNGRDSR